MKKKVVEILFMEVSEMGFLYLRRIRAETKDIFSMSVATSVCVCVCERERERA